MMRYRGITFTRWTPITYTMVSIEALELLDDGGHSRAENHRYGSVARESERRRETQGPRE